MKLEKENQFLGDIFILLKLKQYKLNLTYGDIPKNC